MKICMLIALLFINCTAYAKRLPPEQTIFNPTLQMAEEMVERLQQPLDSSRSSKKSVFIKVLISSFEQSNGPYGPFNYFKDEDGNIRFKNGCNAFGECGFIQYISKRGTAFDYNGCSSVVAWSAGKKCKNKTNEAKIRSLLAIGRGASRDCQLPVIVRIEDSRAAIERVEAPSCLYE